MCFQSWLIGREHFVEQWVGSLEQKFWISGFVRVEARLLVFR